MSATKKRILVVDDTPDIIIIATALLESLGMAVTSASDGLKALEQVKKSIEEKAPFSMVLLDVHMSGMNGNEVAQSLRSMGYKGAIIIFTANPTMAGKKKMQEFGIDAYLNKTQLTRDVLSALLSQYT
jgi:CheY-like chemotaxis protein